MDIPNTHQADPHPHVQSLTGDSKSCYVQDIVIYLHCQFLNQNGRIFFIHTPRNVWRRYEGSSNERSGHLVSLVCHTYMQYQAQINAGINNN